MKKAFLLLFALSATLLLITCSEKRNPAELPKERLSNAKTFIIALLPEQNVFLQKRRYIPLAQYLSDTLGMNVKTRLLDSYDAVYNEMIHNKVDAAFFGSISYVVMDSKLNLESLARPSLRDGTSTYKGVIFARRGKGITGDVATWKGRRIALVNKSTAAGYIYPKWYLHQKGVDNFEAYFRKVIYTGSHDAAIIAVVKGDADIGAAKDQILNKLFQENPELKEQIAILAVSAAVPSNTLGIKANSDMKLKEQLRSALLNMDANPEGRHALSVMEASRFVETRENEYGPLFGMLNDLALKPGALIIETER